VPVPVNLASCLTPTGSFSSASIFFASVWEREREGGRGRESESESGAKGVADADKSHAGKPTEPSLIPCTDSSEVRRHRLLFNSQDLDFIR